MKLNKFKSSYIQTSNNYTYSKKYEEVGIAAISEFPDLVHLFNEHSGAVFEKGLFKIHNVGSFYLWTKLTFEFFKKFKGKTYCFAFDWVGRQYAVNYSNDKATILILDPATAEAFEVEKDIESFFNEDLVELKNEILDVDRYNSLFQKFSTVKFEECFGFKQLLFLGGKDELDNVEPIDLEVYWELNYQVYSKIKNLPSNTLIGRISIE